MPCAELFKEQPAVVRDKLIVPSSKKIVIEAGSTFGWIDIVGGSAKDTIVVGLDRFGASAPANILAEKFGFTPEAVVARVKEKFFS
jgi:transketolase